MFWQIKNMTVWEANSKHTWLLPITLEVNRNKWACGSRPETTVKIKENINGKTKEKYEGIYPFVDQNDNACIVGHFLINLGFEKAILQDKCCLSMENDLKSFKLLITDEDLYANYKLMIAINDAEDINNTIREEWLKRLFVEMGINLKFI